MNPLILSGIFELGSKLIARIFPDPADAAKAQYELMQLTQTRELKELEAAVQLAVAQAATNTEEAKSPNLFVSGWRPAVGWVCACGLFYQLMLRPILSWLGTNLWMWREAPSLELETLMTLLFGMLGLGAYRTVEKLKGKD